MNDVIKYIKQGKVHSVIVWEMLPDIIEGTQEKILEWLFSEDVLKLGCNNIQLISNKTNRGSQFVRGFGGIGAFLIMPFK